MMKIPWTQHASNEQILGMVDESRSLLETLSKRQKNGLGMFDITPYYRRSSKEGLFQRKKTPGRSRAMLLDAMMQEEEESEINYTKLKEKAHDRETWRH